MSLWSRLFGRTQPSMATLGHLDFLGDPLPTYAIGDVHGRLDLLRDLERKIGNDAKGPARVVLLGDFIDRGPESAAILDHLMRPMRDNRLTRYVLRGNHEDMFLKFLENPGPNRKWLGYGGAETLESYGAFGDPLSGFELPAKRLGQILDAHVPAEHREFLADLPYWAELDGFVLSHAGLNPDLPLTAQKAEDLLWSNPARLASAGLPFTVVHGHVAIGSVSVTKACINVDTGAWQSGILSAVCLVAGKATRLIQAKAR